jgi:hypothetical protein
MTSSACAVNCQPPPLVVPVPLGLVVPVSPPVVTAPLLEPLLAPLGLLPVPLGLLPEPPELLPGLPELLLGPLGPVLAVSLPPVPAPVLGVPPPALLGTPPLLAAPVPAAVAADLNLPRCEARDGFRLTTRAAVAFRARVLA